MRLANRLSSATFRSVVASTLLASAAAASANPILVNGSFESGTTGWSLTPPASVRSDEQPSDGNYSLVFDYGDVVGGAASQSFSTVAGQTYTLTFDYWAWFGATTHTLEVDVLGMTPLLGETVTATGSGTGTRAISTFSESFTADSNSAVLSFVDRTSLANGLSSDLDVDRVAVAAVPEPSTYALTLAAFGAAQFARRRRKPVMCTWPR